MVKIPTYTSETRAKAPITRSRPMVANVGGPEVYGELARFADTIGDVAAQVHEKNKRIADDRKNTENMNEYTIKHKEIYDEYSVSRDVENGATNYYNASSELIESIYANNADNEAVAEYFRNRAYDNLRGNYVSIENSILKNNRLSVNETVKDSKFLIMNSWLDAYRNGNSVVMTQQEDLLFGNVQKGVFGVYDKLNNAGVAPSDLTKDQYNENLKSEMDLLLAEQLISEDLNKFYEIYNDENEGFNSLDPSQRVALKIKADNKTNSSLSATRTILNNQKSAIIDNIKNTTSILNDGYEPDTTKMQLLLEQATQLHIDILNANPGITMSGLEPHIEDLTNANYVYEIINKTLPEASGPIKSLPLSDVESTANSISEQLDKTQGTADFDPRLILVKNKLDELVNYRKQNEPNNLLDVGLNSGVEIQPIDFSLTDVDLTELLQKRKETALSVKDQFNHQVPQFFLKNEKEQISQIFNTGDKELIKKVLRDVAVMAGPEYSSYAFEQLSLDKPNGLAHIGILYANVGETEVLNQAIDAWVLRKDDSTKNILSQYNIFDLEKNYNLATTFDTYFNTLESSPLYADRKHYESFAASTKLIFEGMILNNPDSVGTNKRVFMPIKPEPLEEMLIEAIQISAGFNTATNTGGFEEYNGYQITVPVDHKNADFGDTKNNISIEELLENNMTQELFEKAIVNQKAGETDQMYLNKEDKMATIEDIFNQNRVHLIPKGPGRYWIGFGDNPTSIFLKSENRSEEPLVFDLNLIYKDLIK